MSLVNFSSTVVGSSALGRRPVVFPQPVRPDVVRCDTFWNYQAEPQAEGCWDVWDRLPQGTNAQMWYTKPMSMRTRNRLPLELGDERCRIQISASGKAAQEINFPIGISGQTMRDMAGRAIQTCVERGASLGGVMTRGIKRTLNWLTAPDTDFPGNLDIPASTTFITAWVYADLVPSTTYEPGANSEKIGEDILDAIDQASEAQPVGSALRRRIEARYDYISHAVERQDYFFHDLGWPAWWTDVAATFEHSSAEENQNEGADAAVKNNSESYPSRPNADGEACGLGLSGLRSAKCRAEFSRRHRKKSRRMVTEDP